MLVRRPARGAPSAWDVDTGRPVAVEAAIGRLASPRGTWRVDFGEDNKLTFASAKTGAVPSAIVTELDCLEAVAFTRDERTVALGGIGKVIQLFSVADGKQLCRIEVPQRVTHLAFAADERFFAATLGAGDRALFRTEDGEQVALIPSRELTHAAAFSRDGRWAAFVHYGPDGYGGGIAIHPLTAEAKAQLAGAGAKPKAEKRRGPKSPAAGGRPKKRAKKPARKPAKATQRRRTR